jgi:hypothetical protein
MDTANDLELIRYYKDRTVWLVQPDRKPALVSAYSLPGQKTPGTMLERPTMVSQVAK